MHSLFDVFCKHFASYFVAFFDSHHILPLILEQRLNFIFKSAVLPIDCLLHSHANLLNPFIDPEFFFVVVVEVKLLNKVL